MLWDDPPAKAEGAVFAIDSVGIRALPVLDRYAAGQALAVRLQLIDRLAKLELYSKDSWLAVLKDGQQLPVSRSGYARIKELIQ